MVTSAKKLNYQLVKYLKWITTKDMEIFRVKKDIPFMKYSKISAVISVATFILAVFFIILRGLNLGVDFTGGTMMEVSYPEAANIENIREALHKIDLEDAQVQNFGTEEDVLIRLPIRKDLSIAELSEKVSTALKLSSNTMEVKRVESVGSQVGDELYENGALAVLFVCIGIMLYLTLRFEWRFAIAAIIANMHDVVIILGFFAFFQWEFNLTVLAAVLAVLGYSVNESVVVFDRVRENFRKMRKANVAEVINNAITRTMSRTIMTHLSTQTVVISMLIFGGEILHNFALALTIGILFGIYSSIMVGCPMAMWLGTNQTNLAISNPERKQKNPEL
jgi:preprotein translocase subunit SecF